MEINKVGLAAIVDGRLLVVRKRGSKIFILPGGKPEGGENDLQTLQREVDEELGCMVANPAYLESFSDWAADHKNTRITVKLFSGELIGEPQPMTEIEEIKWLDLNETEVPLASSIINHILPYLRARQ